MHLPLQKVASKPLASLKPVQGPTMVPRGNLEGKGMWLCAVRCHIDEGRMASRFPSRFCEKTPPGIRCVLGGSATC